MRVSTNTIYEPGTNLMLQQQEALIKIQQQVSTDGYRVDDISWDGLDEFGDSIGKGVYVYKLTVKAASDNSKANEFQKLVILK